MGGAFKYFKEGSLRYEEPIDTSGKKPTIICVHPHGIFPLGYVHRPPLLRPYL